MTFPLLFDNVSKRYGRRAAVEGLSLQVEAGEIFGFLGPNGAGKSTAIHLAMGFLLPTSGSGALLGMPFDQAREARSRVGYVPDAPVFFAGSPLDAVMLAARLNQAAAAADLRARATSLLRRFDLPTDTRADARKLSRGQQQRLAMVQALVARPTLLMLDEPTSALDPPGVLLVREALLEARQDGAAIFFSSHQMQEVELLCDRAAFLEGGRLLAAGRMAELLKEGATARITLRSLPPEGAFVREHREALVARGSRPSEGKLVFRIALAMQRRFVEQAWAAGGELVEVVREHRSLEDLFAQQRERVVQREASL